MPVIIFPNQLFEDNTLIEKNDDVYLIEHNVYFKLYKYHKLKLILLRSAMKNYEDFLKNKYKCKTHYYENHVNIETIFEKNKGKEFLMYNPIDHTIVNEIERKCQKYKINLNINDSPNFVCSLETLKRYEKSGGKVKHSSFYKWCRKEFDILMSGDNPAGGKWSYDKNNRLPFPQNFKTNDKIILNNDKYVIEATNYVNKYFGKNVGSTEFYLPINHAEAKKHFKKFLKDRLECFGPYQDAVKEEIIYGCHSLLSPLINIGLLNPKYIIDETIKYFNKKKTSIESVEAFIRQLFWREYVMYIYMFYDDELTKINFFKHKNNISKDWYNGTTNIKPIDDLINKVTKYGYLHHIERLMYIGNFMLLSKINPDKVYEWFMTFFVDAIAPWVMKPNVYGMSQFSTGPFMMNRPYFSSSNYIQKMSTYKKKYNVYPTIEINEEIYEWFEIWDALYHNFIEENKNYSTAGIISSWSKKNKNDKKIIINLARNYLKNYT